MGCGVAFEALNHAGSLEKERLLVILNDNRWSIAKTVGALSRYLNRVRSGALYNRTKEALHHVIQSIPMIGKDLDARLIDAGEMLKNMVMPGHIFEELGFRYFGPIDGHNLDQLLDTLGNCKQLDGVTLLHVKTEKGKGVPGSEDRYDRAHAAKPTPKKKQPEKVPVEPCVLQPVVPVAPLHDPPPAPGGQVDFPAVYTAGGVEPEQQERVEKAASLLRSLPAETDPAVKKQIVEASLKAFGVPIDKIIEAGVEEIQALESYIRAGAGDTQTLLSESQSRIAQFEDEVRRIKQVMDERVQEQAAVVRVCNEKKLDVQRVLEFFGQEAVARVVRESPKLIDPSQPPAPQNQ